MPLTVATYLLLGGWLLETTAPNSNLTVVPCQPYFGKNFHMKECLGNKAGKAQFIVRLAPVRQSWV